MDLVHILCVIFSICLLSIDALRFHLATGAANKKCLREEIHKDVLVSGEYELSDAPGQKTDIKVTDSKSHVLFSKEDASKGKFAFTTEEYDMFEVCFQSQMPGGGQGPEREVSIQLKHGVEAKNYENIAKAEKLKPMEVELRRL